MLEGMLFIADNGRLFLVVSGKGRVPVQPKSILDIRLGSYWITGKFEPDFEDDKPVEPYDFVLADGSFCGLRSGMHARIAQQ